MKIPKLTALLLLAVFYVVSGAADFALHHGLDAGQAAGMTPVAGIGEAHGSDRCLDHDPERSHDEDECPCPPHHQRGERHHAAGHSCSFASIVAHTVQCPHGAGLAATSHLRSPLALDLACRLVPGRTATGLAPPA